MRNILLSLFVCCMFIACEEEKLEPYTGNDTVQFYTTNFDEDIVVEYSWGMALDPNAEYDTCWIPVQTMGRAKNYDRYLKLVQEKAVGWDYVYDHVGNIVDSLSYEIPNQAVEGKHYVAFDDPGTGKNSRKCISCGCSRGDAERSGNDGEINFVDSVGGYGNGESG